MAVRALKLLREAGQKEFVEFLAKADIAVTKAEQHTKQMQDTIERQAQAIKRLEEEKTRGGQLGPRRDPPMGMGIMEEIKRSNTVFEYERQMRRTINTKLDDNGPWKQF